MCGTYQRICLVVISVWGAAQATCTMGDAYDSTPYYTKQICERDSRCTCKQRTDGNFFSCWRREIVPGSDQLCTGARNWCVANKNAADGRLTCQLAVANSTLTQVPYTSDQLANQLSAYNKGQDLAQYLDGDKTASILMTIEAKYPLCQIGSTERGWTNNDAFCSAVNTGCAALGLTPEQENICKRYCAYANFTVDTNNLSTSSIANNPAKTCWPQVSKCHTSEPNNIKDCLLKSEGKNVIL